MISTVHKIIVNDNETYIKAKDLLLYLQGLTIEKSNNDSNKEVLIILDSLIKDVKKSL